MELKINTAQKINTQSQTKLMRHNRDEVLEAMRILYMAEGGKYQPQLQIAIEYIEDITKLMEQYKRIAEQSSGTLDLVAKKLDQYVNTIPQDHKKGKPKR